MDPRTPDSGESDWARPLTRGADRLPRKRGPAIHIALFAATFVSVAMTNALLSGANPITEIREGFPFAITLMSILLCHEMGHYLLSRYHRVDATLPYFIPAPLLFIGTFGAFIRIKSTPPTRRALFDIGAAGPWAGMLLAVPAVLVGLSLSDVQPLSTPGGLILGDSLLFSLLTRLVLGVSSESVSITLHPIAFAGWLGLFVTFLNLLPVGQLDGGHVAYALFGRFHRFMSRTFLVILVILGFQSGYLGWFLFATIVALLGVDHPPTTDAHTPLDGKRRVAAWLTVVMFVVTFMPAPLSIAEPPPRFEGERTPVRTLPLEPPGNGHEFLPELPARSPAGVLV